MYNPSKQTRPTGSFCWEGGRSLCSFELYSWFSFFQVEQLPFASSLVSSRPSEKRCPNPDPRCRPWYVIHDLATPSQTRMSRVYIDIYNNVPCVTLSSSIHSAHAGC